MSAPKIVRLPGPKTPGRQTRKPMTLKQLVVTRKAEDAARMDALYGDDRADVDFLRRRGFVITREGELYRVGNHPCTPEQMRAKAARERRVMHQAEQLRAQIPASTDKARLEREAAAIEGQPAPVVQAAAPAIDALEVKLLRTAMRALTDGLNRLADAMEGRG